MTDILQRRLGPSEDAVDSAVGDETVILHLKNSTYYGLDAVGTRIWTLLKEGLAPNAICERLAAEYDIDREVIETDARRFLEELEAQNMIVDA